MENIWSAEEKKNREGRSEKYLEDGKIVADLGSLWLPQVFIQALRQQLLVSAMYDRSSELGLSNLHLRISV